MSSGYIAAATFAQQQLRYQDLLQPGGSEYAVPLVISIEGEPDLNALQRAFDAVIERHDVLRAALPLINEVPMLAIADDRLIELPHIGIVASTNDIWQREITSLVAALMAPPFDMENGPLVRAALARPGNGSCAECPSALIVILHHAIADGGSLSILLDDLVAAYDGALRDTPPQWSELPLQYADYADWEQDRFGAPDAPALAAAMEYWRAALDQVPAALDLPLDRRRQHGGTPSGAAQRLTLAHGAAHALDELARQRGTTPFLAYLAVFFAVLHRWSGLDDLVVAVPVSKRTRPELTRLVGMLVDTLPLRVSCSMDTSFSNLLDQVRVAFHDGLRHRDAPFQRIVQTIGIERQANVPPLMQVLFGTLEPASPPQQASDGTRFAIIDDQADQAAKADLSFIYQTGTDQLDLWCRYDASIFNAGTVQQLLAWFGTVMRAVADAPGRPLSELPLIDPADGRALLAQYNDNRSAYPREHSIAALFYETAAKFAQHTAIDDQGHRVNYATLSDQSARLASALAASGIGQGDAVLLALPMSADFLALVLALLRLGASYVPLDPSHPPAHRLRLAASIDARAAIAQGDDGAEHAALILLSVQGLKDAAARLPPYDGKEVPANATAYVMFTSGSTGEPKGVAVPHRAVVRLVRDTNFAQFGPDTRSAVYSNPAFDASTLEIWAPLLNGGTAVVVDKESILDCQRLKQLLARDRITLLWVTAGLFQELAGVDPGVFAGERLVMTGGDAVNGDAARAVLAAGAETGLRLLNGYGPTENTTFSTVYDLALLEGDSLSVPIGRPIANSTVYILDRCGQPLPPGVVGEIYVGGDGVALGYAGDPMRTAASFLPDPFDDRADARMYRSGDYGRWRNDGTVLFAGRADDQIKLRGFRIELAEIATALGQHPDIRSVHVAAPRQHGGDRQLVAYLVPQAAPGPAPADLRAFLEGQLPAYMLPHAYVVLDALPLNANGKVDRKALPAVQDQHYDRVAELAPPQTEEECILHGIWLELLGLATVDITDNFFHVGGDSITAIRMAARAAAAGLPLVPTDVFQLQTIRQLAEAAANARARVRRVAREQIFDAELVPAAAHGDRGCDFLLASLRMDRSVTVLELALAMQRLAERHDALRLRWVKDGETSRVEIMAYTARLPIRTIEVPELADAQLHDWVDEHAKRLGRGLHLESGVMVTSTLIDRGPAGGAIIVLALHRAIGDETSAGLILSELDRALSTGAAVTTPLEQASNLGRWLNWLRDYADTQASGEGLRALEATAHATAQPLWSSPDEDTDQIVARLTISPAVTAALLTLAPTRLRTTPIDLLCTALAQALEVHPRGSALLIEAIDTQRNMPLDAPAVDTLPGNLECVLPIAAPTGPMDPIEHLKAIKIARQTVAPAGPVFRVLAHTFDLPSASVGVAWQTAVAGAAGAIALHSSPAFSLSVRGILLARTLGDQIQLAWAGVSPAGGAAQLLQRVATALEQMALATEHVRQALYTPADFPLAALDVRELDSLLANTPEVADIYPLSPMQEAMLVHTLGAAQSEINFEQSCMRIRGRLDHAALAHAWKTVIDRHDVLRTAFHWRGLSRPLQVVHRSTALPLEFHRWPAFDAARLDAFLAADRAQGFDMTTAPLLRLHGIQVAEDDLYLVASFHHLLVDGWCLGRLEREVRAIYESVRSGRPALLDTPAPYRSYIAWLAQTDSAAGKNYFSNMLRGLPAGRRLYPPAQQAATGYTSTKLALSREATRALVAFSRRRGLTLAAAIHFAWAVWLSSRLESQDVTFGTTVSGRPADVPGVESIVGLFINNLPVRLQLDAHTTIGQYLAQLHTLLGQLQQHAHLSGADIAETVSTKAGSGPIFDTLVVVENLASGTSAWAGAEGLTVESVQSRLKTAYDLTFIAVPGDAMVLSVVQPDDDREHESGSDILAALAAILTALPTAADLPIGHLPRPTGMHRVVQLNPVVAQTLRFSTRPRSTLEARITAIVADLIPAEPQHGGNANGYELDTEFWQLGLTSLQLSQLALRLGQALEKPVPISLLLEHRSIAALAHAIQAGQSWSPVVDMSGRQAEEGPFEPFICVHPIAGDVSVFLDLARAMPPHIPLWAIQAPGLEEGQTPLDSVQSLASAGLEALAARGLASPRWIGGYSFGGIVAFEMARQLADQGRAPERVIILDTPAPLQRASILSEDAAQADAQWLLRMVDVRARFQDVDTPITLDELVAAPAAQRFELALARSHAAGLIPPAATVEWLKRVHHCSLVQYAAYLAYQPQPGVSRDLPLAVIRAAHPRAGDLSDAEAQQLAMSAMGWQAYTDAEIPVCEVPGDHVSMLGPDIAQQVAAAISDLLQCDQAASRNARAAE
ncbi:amino acid adenylation domain-containing protein [Alcaligenaceae bacterium]|nr:amino acid adenylation domain-containing protein [Alcaligenaceae bacterium]